MAPLLSLVDEEARAIQMSLWQAWTDRLEGLCARPRGEEARQVRKRLHRRPSRLDVLMR
jgi:hypothetical protein